MSRVNITFGKITGNFENTGALEPVRTEDIEVSSVAMVTSVAVPETLSPNERWGFIIKSTASAVYYSIGVNPVATATNTNKRSIFLSGLGEDSGVLKRNEKISIIRAG